MGTPFATPSRPSSGMFPILRPMQTPGQLPPEPYGISDPARPALAPGPPTGLAGLGERLAFVAGLVLGLSSFMGWYAGKDAGAGAYTLSVIGWHTGALGKLVCLIGFL